MKMDEGLFGDLLTKGISKLNQGVLRAGGNVSAKISGRADRAALVAELSKAYRRWLGRSAQKATPETFVDFLRFNQFPDPFIRAVTPKISFLNQQPGERIEPVLGTASSAPAGTTNAASSGTASKAASQSAASKSAGAKTAATASAAKTAPRPPTTPSPAVKAATNPHAAYVNQTMGTIARELKQPNPNKREIFALTKELIAHANDHGGDAKDRVKAFLDHLRGNPKVMQAMPNFTHLKVAECQQIAAFARSLMEGARSEPALMESFADHFLLEAPLSLRTINKGFDAVAAELLRYRGAQPGSASAQHGTASRAHSSYTDMTHDDEHDGDPSHTIMRRPVAHKTGNNAVVFDKTRLQAELTRLGMKETDRAEFNHAMANAHTFEDVQKIVRKLPVEKQTLYLSLFLTALRDANYV